MINRFHIQQSAQIQNLKPVIESLVVAAVFAAMDKIQQTKASETTNKSCVS
jgi:hypothetical protein